MFFDRKLKSYVDSTEWSKEYPVAKIAIEELEKGINAIFENVTRGGQLDVVKLKKSVDPMGSGR